jgi:hypothetical protein
MYTEFIVYSTPLYGYACGMNSAIFYCEYSEMEVKNEMFAEETKFSLKFK